jgi:hypothetical protein
MEDIKIEGAKVIFRNFSGAPTKFRAQGGVREFSILFNTEQAENLRDEGWNVKPLPMREDDEEQMWHLNVTVRFDPVPPKVYLITNHSKTILDVNSIGQLDYSMLKNVDLIVTPYSWNVNGKSGTKAYLKVGYFVVEEDEFAAKYANLQFPDDDDMIPFDV